MGRKAVAHVVVATATGVIAAAVVAMVWEANAT
jgi:hypothetical protein